MPIFLEIVAFITKKTYLCASIEKKEKREPFVPSFYCVPINVNVVEERITDLLEEKFQEPDFADCFIIEIKLHANQKLEVFVDSDSGMNFVKCQKISRYLESFIDEGSWLGEKYTLEVSSPGVERPLKLARQYRNNIGRKLEVKLKDGTVQTGTLIAADEQQITLEEKVRVKEGKRKKTEVVQTAIPFEEIAKAIVKISFGKK